MYKADLSMCRQAPICLGPYLNSINMKKPELLSLPAAVMRGNFAVLAFFFWNAFSHAVYAVLAL